MKTLLTRTLQKLKTQESIKLLLLGGSSLVSQSDRDRFGKELNHQLQRRYSGLNASLLNHFHLKSTTFDGVDVLRTIKEKERFSPDLIFICFGYDDCFGYVYRSEFRENLINMIKYNQRNLHSDVIFITTHITSSKYEWHFLWMYIQGMREVSLGYEIPLIRLDNLLMNKSMNENISIDEMLSEDKTSINDSMFPLLVHHIIENFFQNK